MDKIEITEAFANAKDLYWPDEDKLYQLVCVYNKANRLEYQTHDALMGFVIKTEKDKYIWQALTDANREFAEQKNEAEEAIRKLLPDENWYHVDTFTLIRKDSYNFELTHLADYFEGG
jgi:hypothetical protein